MKISPVMAPTNSVSAQGDTGTSRVDTIRALKMTTNATPDYIGPQDVEKLPILDINEEPNPTVEATQPISPQFAALARERRAIQRDRQLLNQEKAKLAESQGRDHIPVARLKSETLKVLQEAGVTYDDLTQAILETQGNPEINALKAEIDSLKKGVDDRFTQQVTQQEQQVLAEMKREAIQLTAVGDEFELVRETRSVPDVMRLIERMYRETGEVLEVQEACKLVEDELFNRNQKLANLKKMQSLFKQPEPEHQPQQRQTGMRTLTNKDTASVPASAKQRALAAFYGTLKK